MLLRVLVRTIDQKKTGILWWTENDQMGGVCGFVGTLHAGRRAAWALALAVHGCVLARRGAGRTICHVIAGAKNRRHWCGAFCRVPENACCCRGEFLRSGAVLLLQAVQKAQLFACAELFAWALAIWAFSKGVLMRKTIILLALLASGAVWATPGAVDAAGCHDSVKIGRHCHPQRAKQLGYASGESAAQRSKRLDRECRNAIDAGMCSGHVKKHK